MAKASQEACQLYIEQEIDAGLDRGETPYQIGKQVAEWVQKLFEVKVKPKTMMQRARRRKISTNVDSSLVTFNKTNENISWAKWSWNPLTGCKHGCPYCYARDIAYRFYKEKFEPTFHPHRLKAPFNTKIPLQRNNEEGIHNVFVCSMADLFGDWVPQEWIDKVMDAVRTSPQWTYIFLTKNPSRMIDIEWPENAWVGTTVDIQKRVKPAEEAFSQFEATAKFISVEPFLEDLRFNNIGVFDWVIIGGQSRSSRSPEFQPEKQWVRSLVNQAWAADRPLFLKPNLTAGVKEYPK